MCLIPLTLTLFLIKQQPPYQSPPKQKKVGHYSEASMINKIT